MILQRQVFATKYEARAGVNFAVGGRRAVSGPAPQLPAPPTNRPPHATTPSFVVGLCIALPSSVSALRSTDARAVAVRTAPSPSP